MGSLYRSQHELIFVYKNGAKPHINNVELGRFGRNRTNVWNYAGANTFGKDRDTELAMHPTVKPLALVSDAIMDCSNRDGIILDNFAGSGTTLLAAQKTGRRGFGIELDPHYVDTIIQRFSDAHSLNAVLASTGESFEEVRRGRRGPKGEQHDKNKKGDKEKGESVKNKSLQAKGKEKREFARARKRAAKRKGRSR